MSSRAYQYNINKLSQYLVNDLRNQLFKSHSKSLDGFLQCNACWKTYEPVTNDVSMVEALFSIRTIQAIGDTFTLMATITIMVSMTWQLTLLILALHPYLVWHFIFSLYVVGFIGPKNVRSSLK